MLNCPNCNNKIPIWKTWILTRFTTVTCSACKKKLSANRKIGSMIGAVGGGTGAVILLELYRSNFSVIFICLTILWILCIFFISPLFLKFEVKE